MEKSYDMAQFVQCIQNKITLAIGFVIIRSKPVHLTAEEYALTLQKIYFQQWQKKREKSVFDDKIITIQRNNIINQIYETLPTGVSITKCELQKGEINDFFPNIYDEEAPLSLTFPVEIDVNPHLDDDIYAESNIEFIQGMVQLKFAVESKKIISLDKISPLLGQRFSHMKFEKISEKSKKRLCLSEDSGFGESIWNRNNRNNNYSDGGSCISSNVFRFLTHSSETEIVVSKCIKSVMSFVEKQVLLKAVESYNYWQGSLLEHVCSVLHEVSEDAICVDAIISFILSVLEDIWLCEEDNKHVVWEYQTTILGEFCCSREVCERVLNFLVEKFSILSEKVMQLDLTEVSHVFLIEKAPHFFSLALTTFKKWDHYSKSPSEIKNKLDDCYKSVTDLWKLRWTYEKPNEEEETRPSLVGKWKQICEKLVACSSKKYPLISVYLWELIKQMEVQV